MGVFWSSALESCSLNSIACNLSFTSYKEKSFSSILKKCYNNLSKKDWTAGFEILIESLIMQEHRSRIDYLNHFQKKFLTSSHSADMVKITSTVYR